MNLRITAPHWQQVRRHAAISFSKAIRFPPETGCILLTGHNDHPANPALLVSEVLLPEDGELKHQSSGAVTFDAGYLRRALLAVRERRLKGFLTVHTHPLSPDVVCFSGFDDDQDPALMTNLYDLQPQGIFGSVVLGDKAASARIWLRGAATPQHLESLVVVGDHMSWLPLNGRQAPSPPPPAAIFDRALAVTGNGAMFRLSAMRVAVIGGSGTGSLMIELLMRAGVGEIVIFEFDRADVSNLNRVLHLRLRDAENGTPKAARLAAVVNETGLPTRITVVEGGDIRDEEVARELAGCDLLIGCVDRDWPRLILTEVAYQYLIPCIDIGTEIGAVAHEFQSADARVSYITPGRPCLFCSGIITHERIRVEGLADAEQDRVIGMGYTTDIRLKAPAVMDLNMRAASAAMLLVRHLLQPFLATPLPHTVKEAVTNFSIRGLNFTSAADCLVCGHPWRVGVGSGLRLTTRRTALSEKLPGTPHCDRF